MTADRILWCALELQITVVGRGQFVFSCCVLCLGLRDCGEGRSKAMVLKMGLKVAIFSKYFFLYNPKVILKCLLYITSPCSALVKRLATLTLLLVPVAILSE